MNHKYYKIREMVFVPIYAQRHKTNLYFSQDICNYTTEGREKIHQNLKAINKKVLSLCHETIYSKSYD